MSIVPANAELTREFYGRELPVSIRGYFLLNDEGEPLGLSGFIRRSKDKYIIFIDAKDEAFENKRMILKMARMMLDIADMNGWTLIALADESKLTADGFIKHFGFELNDEGEYMRCQV